MTPNILSHYECNLLHTKKPYLTGKKILLESENKWINEIVWICPLCKSINGEYKNEENTTNPNSSSNPNAI